MQTEGRELRLGAQDRPYAWFLDTLTLVADLLARTRTIRVFPDVANLPLRGATMIVKAAASMDMISGGRFERGKAVDALVEAVAVVRRLWSGDRGLRVGGEHYRLAGVHSGPVPAHDVSMWVGPTDHGCSKTSAGTPTAGCPPPVRRARALRARITASMRRTGAGSSPTAAGRVGLE